jgi:hypothetical protein
MNSDNSRFISKPLDDQNRPHYPSQDPFLYGNNPSHNYLQNSQYPLIHPFYMGQSSMYYNNISYPSNKPPDSIPYVNNTLVNNSPIINDNGSCYECANFYQQKADRKRRPAACEICHHYTVSDLAAHHKNVCSEITHNLVLCPTNWSVKHKEIDSKVVKQLREQQVPFSKDLSTEIKKNQLTKQGAQYSINNFVQLAKQKNDVDKKDGMSVAEKWSHITKIDSNNSTNVHHLSPSENIDVKKKSKNYDICVMSKPELEEYQKKLIIKLHVIVKKISFIKELLIEDDEKMTHVLDGLLNGSPLKKPRVENVENVDE